MADHPHPPTWLTEPCPAWCVVLHADDDHPADRSHQSASLAVPVTQLRGIGEHPPPPGDAVDTLDLAVVLHRRVGAAQTWLYVGDGQHQGLELDLGSWTRVLTAVDHLVDRARGADPGRP